MAKDKTGRKTRRPERNMSFEDIESAINEHVSAATSRMNSRSEPKELPKEPDPSIIPVKLKPKTQPQPVPARQDDNKGEPITVSIRRPKPMAEAETEPKPAEQSSETTRLEARVGKTIEPPAGMDKPHETKEKLAPEDTPVSVGKLQASPAASSITTKLDETSQPKAPPTLEHEHLAKPALETMADKDSFATITTNVPETAVKKEHQQVPTVFDTKQYHLPIKPNRHHRQHAVPTSVTITVFALLFLLGGFIAVKIGFVDL